MILAFPHNTKYFKLFVGLIATLLLKINYVKYVMRQYLLKSDHDLCI